MTGPAGRSQREWPMWLNQMPVEEVMALERGGSALAQEYVAYCEQLGREVRASENARRPVAPPG